MNNCLHQLLSTFDMLGDISRKALSPDWQMFQQDIPSYMKTQQDLYQVLYTQYSR